MQQTSYSKWRLLQRPKFQRTSVYEGKLTEYILNIGYGVKKTRGPSKKYFDNELAIHYCIYRRELRNGYSASEIAHELGMPVGTLKNMIRCAEKIPPARLKKLIHENEEFVNDVYRDNGLFCTPHVGLTHTKNHRVSVEKIEL